MHEATFNDAVEIARDIIQQTEELLGPSPAEVTARYFCDHAPSAQRANLRILIWCAEEIMLAWDSVNLIAERSLRDGVSLCPELVEWVADRLAGKRPRPTRRGTDPDAGLARNRGIVDAVQWLVDNGFSATRSKNRGPQASYDGQSACDAVGVALNLSYSGVEGIWTKSAAPNSPFRRRSATVVGVTDDSPPRVVVSYNKPENEQDTYNAKFP